MRDHPRVCGEHYWLRYGYAVREGSSPRVRGTRRPVLPHPRERGIIPACAGNTRPSSTCRRCSRDHPRVCGEHAVHLGLKHRQAGIIPACAGNTRAAWGSPPRCRDHPRVCGEHPEELILLGTPKGSSPRVRGTRVFGLKLGDPRGIIPACAGNTRSRYTFATARRGHPRVCGEHDEVTSETFAIWGSSPRVRGTLSTLSLSASILGIIPACAGNTSSSSSSSRRRRDHPRVCGEHRLRGHGHAVFVGSSPRVRGTLLVPRGRLVRRGIIPACAGNTDWRSSRGGAPGDHPRVCGEHLILTLQLIVIAGSSPRVRGTPVAAHVHARVRGIIPACAGNTRAAWTARRPWRDHPRVCGEHPIRLMRTSMNSGSSPRVRGTLPLRAVWRAP